MGNLRRTYAGELVSTIQVNCPELGVESSNFTADGAETIVTDKFHGGKYKLTVTPITEVTNGTETKQTENQEFQGD